MSYWDTSALVKLYVNEPDSGAFESHAEQDAHLPVTSRIALHEARATFHRHESEGRLAGGIAESNYEQLRQDVLNGHIRLIDDDAAVEREFGSILSLCYQQVPPIPIRTLDALHLAGARVAGEATMVATDRRLREAARRLGLALFPA